MGANERHLRAREVFRRAGGILRTAEALRAGVHPRDLYALRDAGVIERISRGVYRLTDLPPLAEPDLFTVAARVPKAVIALVSALHYHGLTTEIPHEVSIALPQGTSRPRLDWPPLRVTWFSGAMFTSGIETHERDGIRLRVYDPAKTVADCFRFRHRLGVDVALGALRTGLAERKLTPATVLRAARLCRVERVVRPYLEAMREVGA
jgi:predicted transcriptional regulator of viral defense system